MARPWLRSACWIALLTGPLVAQAPLDDVRKKKLADLATRFWKARPKTAFEAWDPTAREALMAEASAMGPIPEGSWRAVADLLWKPAEKLGPRAGDDGKSLATPYGPARFLMKSASGKGKPVLVGLHGGGEGAGDASEAAGTWTLPQSWGFYPHGIRLVHDTWNTVHGERFILTLLEIAKARHQADPDRVYVAGFSMGGTGSWFMAGRHPDLFAAAAPCAGVLMAKPKSQVLRKEDVEDLQHGLLPNVRNLAMWSFIGLEDRNCYPGTFLYVADRMEELKRQDPDGYAGWNFKTIPGLAHKYPPGEPGQCFKFLEKQRRDTFPKRLTWEVATDPYPLPDPDEPTPRIAKRRFYWLGCDRPIDRQVVRAAREDNVVTLETVGRDGVKGLTVFLNPQMIDPAREVVVRHGAKEVYRGRPAPDAAVVLDAIDARCEASMIFDRRIDL
ncbi:MAG TPA: alpha/beta hydrolase-fold protein [Planctomycetota bacterium]|nr:alpha/beta hydrolase-fold protein [Planctomycetota bacterium]